MTDDQPKGKPMSISDRALEWGYLVAAGLAAVNFPVDLWKYRNGDEGLLPIVGSSSIIIAYGTYKWLQASATTEALNAANADVSAAKMVREDEVDELESRLGRRPDNRNLPKP